MKARIVLAFTLLWGLGLWAENLPLWQEIPLNFGKGILQANYQAVPLREMLVLDKLYLPRPDHNLSTEHPRLLFRADNNQIFLRQNIWPYNQWAGRIFYLAEDDFVDPSSSFINEIQRSEIAKFNSFAYYLKAEPGYLQRARTALINISPTLPPLTPEGGEYNLGWGDWMQAAEALRNFSVAYDLIYHHLSAAEKKLIEKSLIAQTEQIYQHFSHFPSSWNKVDIATGLGIPKNNHIIDIAIGVLTVALVIDSERSNIWLEEGLQQLGLGLSQILADGSYTEGGYYGQYVASRLFQFAIYYQNCADINLHQISSIRKFSEWLLAIERSDESVPLWDDAQNIQYFYKPLAIGLSEISEELQAVFQENSANYFSHSSRMVEAFCAYDNRVSASRIVADSKFYAEGGQLVFRNNNLQALLLAEPPQTLSKHDHIDHLSFTFSAYQHHFIIDSGYGPQGVNDPDRNWFLAPEAHNIPLVNGFGPDKNPSWGDSYASEIKNNFIGQELATAEITTFYRESKISRTAILPDSDYMIIIDELSSDGQARFSIPWQGLGDFTIGSRNKARWQQTEAALDLEYLSLVPGQIRPRMGLNSYSRQDNSHQTAEFALDITSSAQVVSLLLPSSGLANLHSEQIFPQSRQPVEARKISNQNSDDYLILAETDWSYLEFASDAEFCFIQNKAELGLILKAASWFEYRGEKIFFSSHKIDLVLELQQNWRGSITSSDIVEVAFLPAGDPQVIFIDGKIENYHYHDGMVQLQNIGSRQFSFATPSQLSIEPARGYFPMLIKLQHDFYPDLSQLSGWEKNKLRNEIMDYSLLALSENLTWSELWKNIYGVGSGLLANSWDAEESFGLALPQQFRLQRQIFNQDFSYFEEGKLTSSGIRPYYQSVNWSDKLYLSWQTPFADYQLARADYYHQRGNLLLQWQNYRAEEELVFQSKTNWQQVDYRLAWAWSQHKNNWQDLGIYGKQQWLNLRLQQQDSNPSYHLASAWQRQIYAARAEVLFQEELQLLNLAQNIRFNRANRWETGWRYRTEEQEIYSKFYNQTASTASLLDFHYQKQWRFSLDQRWQLTKFTLYSKLQKSSEYYSQLKLRSKDSELNYELSWDSDQLFFAQLHLSINRNLAFVLAQDYNFRRKSADKLRCGTAIYTRNYYWLNVGLDRLEEQYHPRAELVSKLNLSAENQLDLTILASWKQRHLDELELRLQNNRQECSPGILLTWANGNLEKASGYISWFF